MTTTIAQTLVTFTIDGRAISVPKGTTVYTAAKQLGIEIPIFCYQDRMPPFGACRMCLVEVEKMPKLQTACTLEVTEGMVVKTQTMMAVEGRKGILEFLLINHPLDCPICDRGGECPLQDQALKFGPGESRFFEEKRHFKKALPLGPVLMLDRERCIVCARCTRFGENLAGDHALEFIERGYRTEVGTPDGGPAESKFIGNTIMICPVGALTSQVYRFRARPWDNEPTESTCTLCPVGCSMILDSRDGEIMRTRSHENKDVNDIWLCDKGWFGYEFTSNKDRLTKPLIRRSGKLQESTWEEALTLIAKKISESKAGGKLAAFGGNPLTVEENYLFQQLMRKAAGVNHVDHRVGMPLFSLQEEAPVQGMEMSIGECESLSFVVLLGLDLTEEFPVIWLRLRQAINHGAKVIFAGHFAPEIAPYLTKTLLHAPGKEVETINQLHPEIEKLAENGNKGAVFVGRQYLASHHRKGIVSALLNLKEAMPQIALNIMEGKENSFGARLAGMRPDAGPLGAQVSTPGHNALQVLEKSARDGWSFLYVAGADPAVKFPSKVWSEARANLGMLVVQDIFMTRTAEQADIVLPALAYVEKKGSFINVEGRVQTLRPGKEIPEGVLSDGDIFIRLAKKLNVEIKVDADFLSEIKAGSIIRRPYSAAAAVGDNGTVIPAAQDGKVAASFAPALFDNGVRMKHNDHLIKLAKEPRVRIHPNEAAKRGIRQGDVVFFSTGASKIEAKVKVDSRVAEGTAVVPIGFDSIPVHELGANLLNGMLLEIEPKNWSLDKI